MFLGRFGHGRLAVFALVAFARQTVVAAQLGSGALVGARSLLASVGLVLLVLGIAARFDGGRQRLRLAAADLLICTMCFVDLLHFRAFGDLPTVASLRFLGQLGAVGPAVLDLFRPADLLLLAGLPILLLPGHAWPRFSRRAVVATVAAGVLLLVTTTATAKHRRRYKGNAYFASYVGLVGYHVTDAITYLGKTSRRLVGRTEAALQVRDVLAARPGQPPSALWGVAEGRNVIVVQLESFQGFATGLQVAGQAVTPNLDALARESIQFGQFFEQAAFGRTSDAQFTANCSLFSANSGAVVFEYSGNDFRCLPAILADAGYHTALFQPLNRDFWNSAVFDPRLGFSEVVSARELADGERIGLGLSDRAFFRQLVPRLEALPEPFHAFVLSATSHLPYEDPKLPRSLALGELEGTRAGWYLHALHYTDDALGEMLAALRSSGLLDRSLLVVYGDHDGLTRRIGNIGDLLPFADDDELAYFREEQRVPLFVRFPGGATVEERGEVAAQIDLAPTLLGLLGIERNESVFLGRDLFARIDAEPAAAFPNGAVLTADRLAFPDGRCFGPDGKLPRAACAGLIETWEPLLAASTEILERNLIPHLLDERSLHVDVLEEPAP